MEPERTRPHSARAARPAGARCLWARDQADHRGGGLRWLAIGTRPDGSQCVLEEAKSRSKAARRARLFRQHPDGYTRVAVERAW